MAKMLENINLVKEKMEKVMISIKEANIDEAIKYLDETIEIDPDYCPALVYKASFLMEDRDLDEAIKLFDRAIKLEPYSGYSKYLSRAQCSTGKSSVKDYQKAIDIMKREFGALKIHLAQIGTYADPNDTDSETSSESENEEEDDNVEKENSTGKHSTTKELGAVQLRKRRCSTKINVLKREISTVYCSIAEVYLTDLCDERNAETLCDQAIFSAIENDDSCAEAFIMKARFEIYAYKTDAAKKTLEESKHLWCLPEVDGETPQLFDEDQMTQLAKTLISVEMHSDAEDVLMKILILAQEDDEPETHYLLGWNLYMQGEEFYSEAKRHFSAAKEKCEILPCNDPAVEEHIDELLLKLEDYSFEDDEASATDEVEELDDEQMEQEIIQVAEAADAEELDADQMN